MSKEDIGYVIYVPMWWKISRKFLHHFDRIGIISPSRFTMFLKSEIAPTAFSNAQAYPNGKFHREY